ncbi:hypothetical protein [uncultured Ruegeria sp.]|uniref:hypothetical protein n=1 Tax=uncultured Ruegeria sp. TaxID=259304 RepID=UPI00260FB096|nr:hypothetical protein [uncultured Ruegeria sp.]
MRSGLLTRKTTLSGNIPSIRHKHSVQIRELVAFPKRGDLQELRTDYDSGTSRPFLTAKGPAGLSGPGPCVHGPG